MSIGRAGERMRGLSGLWGKLPRRRTRPAFERLAMLRQRPLISVIVPGGNAAGDELRRTVDSVRAQVYPEWKLLLGDPALNRDDRRVAGEFYTLLDAGDELAPDALLEIAEEIDRHPGAGMIYTDEDTIDKPGVYAYPFYKPDWSPEYLLSCEYACRLAVYRTELARNLGGLPSALPDARAYDIALRIAGTGEEIYHVPKVLYHRRPVQEGSNAAEGALRDHLARSALRGDVLPGPVPGYHRVKFAVEGEPLVSIIIPTAARSVNYGGKRVDLLAECLSSLRAQSTWPHVEIVVVDDGALDANHAVLIEAAGAKRVSCHADTFNFSRKCNFGARQASGDHLLFLNDDVRVIAPDWIERMLEYSQQPRIGAVGALLRFPDGRIQHAGVVLLRGSPHHAYHGHPAAETGYFRSVQVPRNYLAVTAACLMTKAEAFREVGGFDEAFPVNYNDVDYCLRLRERGYRTVYTPYAELCHYASASRGRGGRVRPEELKLFHERWQSKYGVDPYYNPNLPTRHPYYRG